MQKKTVLEKVTGNLIVESTLTLAAAVSGVAVAALLPLLTNTLAEGRHKKGFKFALKK